MRDKKVRVIQLIGGMDIGFRDGGAEYFGLQLARFLDRQEFEAAIFSMWYYGSEVEQKWLDEIFKENLQVAGLVPFSSPVRDLPYIYSKLWVFISDFNPDIIHSHSQRGDLLAIAMKWLHPFHPQCIRTVHIDQPWLNRYWADLLFNHILFPLAFDTEVAVSDTIQDKINKRLIARLLGKTAPVCYNGIDARLFNKGLPGNNRVQAPPPDIPNVHPCIGFIGRLVKQKGASYLLQAMALVNQCRPVYLLIIGTGPLEPELRRQTQQSGLEDKVFFLGRRSDVLEILPHLDIVVIPSLWEGLSTVMLEAMAFRVPVIATHVSGSCEVIRHNETGLLVAPQDPVGLAQAILTLLDNSPEAQRMAERAYSIARSYTIQNAARNYAEIYRQLLRVNPNKNSRQLE